MAAQCTLPSRLAARMARSEVIEPVVIPSRQARNRTRPDREAPRSGGVRFLAALGMTYSSRLHARDLGEVGRRGPHVESKLPLAWTTRIELRDVFARRDGREGYLV